MNKITIEQFRTALWILLHNFHAVNKKIFACLISNVYQMDSTLSQAINAENYLEVLQNAAQSSEEQLRSHLESSTTIGTNRTVFIVHQKLLTKKLVENLEAISFIDFYCNRYTCLFPQSTLDDFVINLVDGELKLQALTQKGEKESSDRWLEFVLKPKLINWAKSENQNNTCKTNLKSLQLIDIEEYNDLYKSLKMKYSENLKANWLEANESTDPLKFIYEDIAIASYLICLWRSTNARPPTAFADLGCGNGLLVYILIQEGYNGYGYDIRKRKLWSMYPKLIQEKLIETAIHPDKFSPPLEVDWLIGNHSDELSPWLPVLAALGSYQMSYFLLPCCAYELSGAKFQRRNARLSIYQDFFDYAYELSLKCDFNTMIDRLKIPSTKRLAIVGFSRNYKEDDYSVNSQELKKFIEMEIIKFPHASKEDNLIKLRERNETVRNCTKVDRSIIDNLVANIFQMLLLATPSPPPNENTQWFSGGRVTLKEIALSLSTEELKNIKAECGGIKTLLRNKHEIFEFHKNNLIGLRKPQKRLNSLQNIKKRPCYFDENHPNGCPLTATDCTFIHRNEKCR